MKYALRDYQQSASDAAVHAFHTGRNGLIIVPTGGGKSLIIADIAARLGQQLLVLQPSKEILEQNYLKLRSYGITDCSIYSASVGCKEIGRITFAMIGSVMGHIDDFNCFRYVVVDEAHYVNAKAGMYKQFIEARSRVVIGFTATPFRLATNRLGSILKFLTRTRPRIFDEVLYACQVEELHTKGYLANVEYYDITSLDMTRLLPNSSGADYSDRSVLAEYTRTDFYGKLSETIRRLQHPKSGIPRRGILVFTRFIREAERLCNDIQGAEIVTGATPKKEREAVLARFKTGQTKVVCNVGCLTTGFDYPELDTIVLARPTKSLGLYYQMVGRGIRPSSEKASTWVIDLSGTFRRYGRVEDLYIGRYDHNMWCVASGSRVLTNRFID